jgi:hypothetical protein
LWGKGTQVWCRYIERLTEIAEDVRQHDGGVDTQPERLRAEWTAASALLRFDVAIDESSQGGFARAANAGEGDGGDAGLDELAIDLLDHFLALLDSPGVGRWGKANDATKGGFIGRRRGWCK